MFDNKSYMSVLCSGRMLQRFFKTIIIDYLDSPFNQALSTFI